MKEVPRLSKYLQPPHQGFLPGSLESFTYIRLTHMNKSLNLDLLFALSRGKIFFLPFSRLQIRKVFLKYTFLNVDKETASLDLEILELISCMKCDRLDKDARFKWVAKPT